MGQRDIISELRKSSIGSLRRSGRLQDGIELDVGKGSWIASTVLAMQDLDGVGVPCPSPLTRMTLQHVMARPG